MGLITGKTVILFDKKKTGENTMGEEIFTETPVKIKNVLIAPASSTDITGSTQLSAKSAIYDLYIPKGDKHKWENRKVEFYGAMWHTVGCCLQYIPENTPGDWDRRIQVESYV